MAYPDEIEIYTLITNPILSKLLYSIKSLNIASEIIIHRLDKENFEITLRFHQGKDIEINYYGIRNDNIQEIFNRVIIFMLDSKLLSRRTIEKYTRYKFDTELLCVNQEDIDKYLVLKELVD